MELNEILKKFIQSFVHKGYSKAKNHTSTLGFIKEKLTYLFKKKFEIDLPQDVDFYLDIFYDKGQDYYEEYKKVIKNMSSRVRSDNLVRVQCSQKSLRNLKAVVWNKTGIKEERLKLLEALNIELDLFKEYI